ncbi:hypothetical protein BDZ91DRAFT_716608 [Kalaharituber pfeilii]|nr:hypothetical protein BDZ91DRAFT_716608 [Kalaharituber pfeilii]
MCYGPSVRLLQFPFSSLLFLYPIIRLQGFIVLYGLSAYFSRGPILFSFLLCPRSLSSIERMDEQDV